MLPAIIAALAPILIDTAAKEIFGADTPAAAKVTDAVVQVASDVTGIPIKDEHSANNAKQVLALDPAKQADLVRAVNERTVAILAEETKQLAQVNETMRAELANNDPYVRRMRPTWGYIMALTWAAQMGAASYIIATDPGKAAGVLSGIAETTMLWGIGLTVLGLYVTGRSKEKGAAPMDFLSMMRRK